MQGWDELTAAGDARSMRDLLARNGGQPPRLRQLLRSFDLGTIPEEQYRPAVIALASRWGQLWQPFQAEMPWCEGDDPAGQVHRLFQYVASRQGREVTVPEWPRELASRAALRAQWFAQSLDLDAPAVLAGESCRLHLMVVAQTAGGPQGQLLELELQRVATGSSHEFELAPGPDSALLACTATWHAAMDRVRDLVAAHLDPQARRGMVIRWGLHRPGGWLMALDGDSASAAMALGCLWLMRHELNPREKQPGARRLHEAIRSLSSLFDVHITGAIDANGNITAVRGVHAKAEALLPTAEARGTSTLFMLPKASATAAADALAALGGGIEVVGVERLADLAEKVARRRPLYTLPQQTVLRALLARDKQAVRALDPNTLEAVARTEPVTHLGQYALARWAYWAGKQGGKLHLHFVPLELTTHHLPEELRDLAGSHGNLHALLGELHDSGNGIDRLDALLLQGGPGAGKSTLLQHLEMALCVQLLTDLQSGKPVTEVPVLLPMARLPADMGANAASLLPWLREWLRDQHPQCAGLHALLVPAGAPARANAPSVRWLLDGLNETSAHAEESRAERVGHILLSLCNGFGRRHAMVLSARARHQFEMDALRFGIVSVLPWDRESIGKYVNARFAKQPEAGANLNAALQKLSSADLELFQVPFNLAGQCELWEQQWKRNAGPEQPTPRLVRHRAELYRRLLHEALVRELARNPDTQLPRNPLMYNQSDTGPLPLPLLTEQDRRDLRACAQSDGVDPLPWPSEGVLLPSLFRQARAQWLKSMDDAPHVKPEQRGEVAVLWNDPADAYAQDDEARRSVVHWLKSPADPRGRMREAWLQAVRALGIADADMASSGSAPQRTGTRWFAFSHQSWGEYCASVGLLTATPQEMPEAQREDLLQRLQRGRVFANTDEAERAATLRMAARGIGDLDEVLGLALLDLADPRPWLVWLLAHDLWPALQPSLAALALRLEPAGAWPGEGEAPVDPTLQHLRRVLLTRMLDAGSESRRNVEVSGQWQLLLDTEPIAGLPAVLVEHWQSELRMAFGTHEVPGNGGKQRGRDLRERLQAGAMLGDLGDNIRYERRAVGSSWGLRLRDALWAPVGQPGKLTRFRIGSPEGDGHPEGCGFPVCDTPPMPYFHIARMVVTVGEWRRFVEAAGYADAEKPHWRAAGPAAQRWLRNQQNPYKPRALTEAKYSQALQPITTITTYEAVAYAHWASGMEATDSPLGAPSARCEMPNELQWEAAMRCDAAGQPQRPHRKWAHQPGLAYPEALDFNWADTVVRHPTAVGLFSRGYSEAGLADGAGNVLQWCCNVLSPGVWNRGLSPWNRPGEIEDASLPSAPEDGGSARMLRGSAFDESLRRLHSAYRHYKPAGYPDEYSGLRLVRMWPPHSET